MKLTSVAHKPAVNLPLRSSSHLRSLPTRPETGLRVFMAIKAGSPSFESAEFLKRMLPAGSRVRVLTVRSYDFQGDGQWEILGPQLPAGRDTQAKIHRITLRFLDSIGAKVSAKQRFGYPPDEILAEASDWGADVILVGHHNGLGRWFVGSVADHLLSDRWCRCWSSLS